MQGVIEKARSLQLPLVIDAVSISTLLLNEIEFSSYVHSTLLYTAEKVGKIFKISEKQILNGNLMKNQNLISGTCTYTFIHKHVFLHWLTLSQHELNVGMNLHIAN